MAKLHTGGEAVGGKAPQTCLKNKQNLAKLHTDFGEITHRVGEKAMLGMVF